jgi:hypothetical protein
MERVAAKQTRCEAGGRIHQPYNCETCEKRAPGERRERLPIAPIHQARGSPESAPATSRPPALTIAGLVPARQGMIGATFPLIFAT